MRNIRRWYGLRASRASEFSAVVTSAWRSGISSGTVVIALEFDLPEGQRFHERLWPETFPKEGEEIVDVADLLACFQLRGAPFKKPCSQRIGATLQTNGH